MENKCLHKLLEIALMHGLADSFSDCICFFLDGFVALALDTCCIQIFQTCVCTYCLNVDKVLINWESCLVTSFTGSSESISG